MSARNHLHDTSNQMCEALLSVCKTVYLHDPWTCPVTVQHALQELIRALGAAAFETFAVLKELMHVICSNPRTSREALARLSAQLEQSLPWPSIETLQPYFDQIQSYLLQDPGSQ